MNRTKLKRILAIVGIVFFAGVFISLIIQLIKGAAVGVILAHLFCLMIIPCMIYGFLILIGRHDRSEQ